MNTNKEVLEPQQQQTVLNNKNINIGKRLTYRDHSYCEVVTPSYTLFHIVGFLITCIVLFVLVFFVNSARSNTHFELTSMLNYAIAFGIMIIFYLICLRSKDFSSHIKQSYYQPIVFNRQQQKVYIHNVDSKNDIKEVNVLDFSDLKPKLEVDYRKQMRYVNGRKIRHFFDVRLVVEDSNGNYYPVFHQFHTPFICLSPSKRIQELLAKYENELWGYWNWCEAYMQYQDEKLVNSKISKHFFKAKWPEDTRKQFASH